MGKSTPIDASPFTAGVLADVLKHMRETDSPSATFRAGGAVFTVTLKRLDGRPVMSKAEKQLAQRVKQGQQDLNPREIRIARRILSRKPVSP